VKGGGVGRKEEEKGLKLNKNGLIAGVGKMILRKISRRIGNKKKERKGGKDRSWAVRVDENIG